MEAEPRFVSKRKPRKCPQCGAQKVVSIVYGMPSMDLVEEAYAGKVALGGCMIMDDSPYWQCTNCGTEIHSDRPRFRDPDEDGPGEK